jgi:membrane protein required for colicin V production
MLDVIFLVLLIIGTYSGYKRGFILEVLGIIAIFIALYGAFKLLRFALEMVIDYLPGYSSIVPFTIFIILFILIIIAINILGRILKKFIDATVFGSFDSIAGAIAGFFMWSFMISLFIWLLQQTSITLPQDLIQKSHIYPYVVNIAPTVGGYFSSLFPFAGNIVTEIRELFAK